MLARQELNREARGDRCRGGPVLPPFWAALTAECATYAAAAASGPPAAATADAAPAAAAEAAAASAPLGQGEQGTGHVANVGAAMTRVGAFYAMLQTAAGRHQWDRPWVLEDAAWPLVAAVYPIARSSSPGAAAAVQLLAQMVRAYNPRCFAHAAAAGASAPSPAPEEEEEARKQPASFEPREFFASRILPWALPLDDPAAAPAGPAASPAPASATAPAPSGG
eukprot:jgi/Mesen1/10318/ME000079S09734